jgi:signal transduction histidine kinase
MRETTPEPGFVQAYRLFMVIRLLFWAAVGPVLILLQLAGDPNINAQDAAGQELIRRLSVPNILPLVGVELLLLALLLWQKGPDRLGRGYVPATLVIGVAPLLIGYYWWPAVNPLQSPFIMFFFVTAMLIAWEYSYRYIFFYVAALSIFEALVSPRPFPVPWTVPVGWLVLQAVMMLLAGYVTAALVSVQREQRSALARAYQMQAAANQRLQAYAATLEELTISRERNRMARELHDTLAHSLSALTVQLEAVRTLWATQPDKAERILEQADETARLGLAEARRALQALRASLLEELGLIAAIRRLAEDAAQAAGTQLTLSLPDQLAPSVSLGVEQGVYRIAQETLENIVRHACARTIFVRLEGAGDGLRLTIEDDGAGLDTEALPTLDDEMGDRLGIRGMQERARLINGQLEISSRPGEGTRVTLAVPTEGRPTEGRPTEGRCNGEVE